jgi:hypothetical protein
VSGERQFQMRELHDERWAWFQLFRSGPWD